MNQFKLNLWLARAARAQERRAAAIASSAEIEIEDDGESRCSNPGGHEWAYTGTAYGGDDESYHGEGRAYCQHCGADGDA